jgi:hypothetical protein
MNFSALYFRKPMLVLALLGFSSGLPLALSGATLQAWLTVEGLDLKTIGFFALVGLPYTFKFAWAPLLDRFDVPGLPRAQRLDGFMPCAHRTLVSCDVKLRARQGPVLARRTGSNTGLCVGK